MYANGNKYVSADLVCLVYLPLALLALNKRGRRSRKQKSLYLQNTYGLDFSRNVQLLVIWRSNTSELGRE